MKSCLFCTIFVLFLPLVTKAEISENKGQEKAVNFEDFIDIKDERTTLLFDFNREFNFLKNGLVYLQISKYVVLIYLMSL